MNRRTTFMLTGIALLGLAIAAFPQVGFAQSDALPSGIFQLNLAKSKFSPGPPFKSVTLNYQAEGPTRKVTAIGFDAQGNPFTVVYTDIADGKSYPVTGSPNYDASAITRVDAYTASVSLTKAGKVVETDTRVLSQDGKTLTFTLTGTDASGRQHNDLVVCDKQ